MYILLTVNACHASYVYQSFNDIQENIIQHDRRYACHKSGRCRNMSGGGGCCHLVTHFLDTLFGHTFSHSYCTKGLFVFFSFRFFFANVNACSNLAGYYSGFWSLAFWLVNIYYYYLVRGF